MPTYARWTTDGEPRRAVERLLRLLLEREITRAAMVPARSGRAVMQSLVTDPSRLEAIDPFAPVVWTNGATLAASLTFESPGVPIAVLLRSCELRAFVELTKLNQASREDLLIIGVDCAGRYENQAFLELDTRHDELGRSFLVHAASRSAEPFDALQELVAACRACEHVVPEAVDVRIGWLGADPLDALWLEAVTDKGEQALRAVGAAPGAEPPAGRQAVLAQVTDEREAFRDALFADFTDKTKDPDGLRAATATCINCLACRVACPVCYCRQCVFSTELFRHPGTKYLAWSRRMGSLRMPTDTVLYHLTRMVHMSTLCVGCGQCSSVCPNDVPVMELFRTVAKAAQERFDYVPGRGFDEPQPLAAFHDDELADVTGQHK